MSAVATLTSGALRHQSRRFLSAMVSVVVGVAFVAAVLALGSSMRQSVRSVVAGDLGAVDLVVQAPSAEQARRLGAAEGVEVTQMTYAQAIEVDGRWAQLSTLGSATEPGWYTAGHAPAAGHVVVSPSVVSATGAGVGDTITLDIEADGPEGARRVDAVIDGVLDPPEVFGGMPVIHAAAGDIARWVPGATPQDVRLDVREGTSHEAALATVRAAAPGTTVRTGAVAADDAVAAMLGEVNVLRNLLLAFAAIALFVCALVVSNTFAIVAAQRRRELALQRALGASRSQIMRMALAEAAAIGLVASLVGVALGIGLAAVLTRVAASTGVLPAAGAALEPAGVLVPVLAGLLVTVGGALAPAVRATSVSPLAAMRPVESAEVSRRVSAARAVMGGLLTVGSLAGMVHFARADAMGETRLLAAMVCGALSVIGVLVLSPVIVPLLARAIGSVTGRAGLPARLASENAVRNPGRAAATASALFVGITLIATVLTALATMQRTADHALASEFPADVVVSAPAAGMTPGEGLPGDVLRTIRSTRGVEAIAPITAATVQVSGQGVRSTEAIARGVDRAAIEAALHDGTPVAALQPGTVLIDQDSRDELGVEVGDRLTLGHAGRHLDVVVAHGIGDLTLTASDMGRLAPRAVTGQVFVRVADGTASKDVVTELTRATREVSTPVEVVSVSAEKELMDRTVQIMTGVVVGLLAVAVLIALVGIGNTLSLSVLERTRESALLRALGLTRGGLRATVAWEAAVLALVGVVLGTSLGVLYGWAGVRAALFGTDTELVLSVPWVRLGLSALLAVGAALLASVLPARRASLTAPAEGLTAD